MLTIDTHQHLFPADYVEMLSKDSHMTGGLDAAPKWSPELALETMDRFGIGTGILSNPVPSFGTEADARQWARAVNEVGSATVTAHPDRFGYFAMIPLPYIDAAIDELNYAYDSLHVDGVILLANTEGTYLGDPSFEPLMRELNARKAVVFVHPNNLPGPVVPGWTPPGPRSSSFSLGRWIGILTCACCSHMPAVSFPTSRIESCRCLLAAISEKWMRRLLG
jgi:predicted TIM-barrel fold metal-dependent hydrolase